MEKIIGWGLAAVAAVVAIVLVTREGAAKPSPKKDLCLSQLPEPFKKQATDIVKSGDVARMESFAVQCVGKGWFCAANELRAVAKKPQRSAPSDAAFMVATEKPGTPGGFMVADLGESPPAPTEEELRWPGIAAMPEDLRTEAFAYMTPAYDSLRFMDSIPQRIDWRNTAHSLHHHASVIAEIGYPDAAAEIKALAVDLDNAADSGWMGDTGKT